MTFEKEILKFEKNLIKLDHKVIVPFSTKEIIGKKAHDKLKVDRDLIRYYYHEIKKSDAIFVPNFTKNGIKNYIGGNTLMDMSFAYVHNKKIFLLNPVPEISYKDEILAMDPIVINGDLSKITKI